MSLKFPKFSVLMSVYWKEKPSNLRKSLESLEQQTVLPNEIVLVEDGPLGASLDRVVKEFLQTNASLQVVKISHQTGLANALNVGLNHVTYDLVARMDSDDISVKDRFKIQLSYFLNQPGLTLLGGQLLEFEDGNEANIIGKREVPLSRRAIERFARFRSPFNHPTVMFRKKAILALGGYERLDFLEDYLLWAKLIATGAVVTNCPDVLLLMRSGANLYGRRGGMKYFRNYCLLRRKLHSMGIINSFQVIIGDFAVLSSSLVPTYVRGLLYKKILHKG